jgi:cytoskeletal protein RodZ
MADEARNKSTGSAPPSAPPPIVTQTRAREGRPWLALLVYLIIALAVAAIIVLGGRWVYHKVRNEPAQETATTSTNKTAEQKAATEGEKSQSSSSSKKNSASSAGQSSSSESQSSSNSSQDAEELANTGPGQVVALFVTVTLAASGLHYIYRLRQTT